MIPHDEDFVAGVDRSAEISIDREAAYEWVTKDDFNRLQIDRLQIDLKPSYSPLIPSK